MLFQSYAVLLLVERSPQISQDDPGKESLGNQWQRIANRFEIHPDWAIKILSPEQPVTKVLAKLLHCSRNGTELGWLINRAEESVVVGFPEQQVEFYQGETTLPILNAIDLELTGKRIFSWLAL